MPSIIDLHANSPRQSWFSEFSEWVPWAQRHTLRPPWPDDRLDRYGGVYVLAHLPDGVPLGAANYIDPAIEYVGEGKHLRRRWNDFERAAQGGTGHSGGTSYFKRHGGLRSELCIAAIGVWISADTKSSTPEEPWTTAYRLHVERHVIWSIIADRKGKGIELLNKK